MTKIAMLTTEDIYDFYASQFIYARRNDGGVERGYVSLVEERIDEIHEKYLVACKARIASECKFLGIAYDGEIPMTKVMTNIGASIDGELMRQSEKLMHGGGFNVMEGILKQHMAAGKDVSDVDVTRFGVSEEDIERDTRTDAEKMRDSLFKDPKWEQIAEAYIAVEESITTQDKIDSVDHLNDLQHNSFHLLIDLQTGRMLEGQVANETDHTEAVRIVNDVLSLKTTTRGPQDYMNHLSAPMRDVIKQNPQFRVKA